MFSSAQIYLVILTLPVYQSLHLPLSPRYRRRTLPVGKSQFLYVPLTGGQFNSRTHSIIMSSSRLLLPQTTTLVSQLPLVLKKWLLIPRHEKSEKTSASRFLRWKISTKVRDLRLFPIYDKKSYLRFSSLNMICLD